MSNKPTTQIDADIKINELGDLCQIHIESLNNTKLSPQDIVDSVVDLVMVYFGMTKEDWDRCDSEGMDS